MHKFLTASFVMVTSTMAHALPPSPCESKTTPCCEEPKPGPFAFNYSPDRNIACSQNFYVHADALAFQAKQDGMEFAIQDGNGANLLILNGEVIGFDDDKSSWGYNAGARFGLGSYLKYDSWNIDFNWTHVNISEYKTLHVTDGVIVNPLWLFGSNTLPTTNTITAASAWKASYNMVDLQLGKPYHLSHAVKCLLHAGLRLGWIGQNLSQRYGWQIILGGQPVNNPIVHGNNDFWGVGGRIGLDTDWIIGKGWSLFANASGSMLSGKFSISQKNGPLVTETDFVATGGNLRRHMHQNMPNIEMAFGLAWNQHFLQNRYQISLRAAYEFIEWFDQLNLRKFFEGNSSYTNDVISRGNFTMNGFSLRLQLDI